MTSLRNVALLIATLAIAACTNPDRFDSGGAGANLDPNSPAYFNQTIGDRVLFLVDQSTLSDEARVILTGQARWLANNPSYSATIEGHADEQGTREYNFALSARRAAAVKDFLVSQGVASGRLKTIPYGKERPIAICSDETCYSQNRRGVTVVSGS